MIWAKIGLAYVMCGMVVAGVMVVGVMLEEERHRKRGIADDRDAPPLDEIITPGTILAMAVLWPLVIADELDSWWRSR